MTNEYQIRVLPEVAADSDSIKRYLKEEKGLTGINAIRILKRSIDARQRTIYVNLTVRVYVNEQPEELEYTPVVYPEVDGKPQVIVVGAGPGGLFAALRLIELGLKPVVIERGKDVHQRKLDIANISRTQTVDAESNYSFGEGGAGAYSDGKLYTRSKKRGNVEKILNVFCQHGASSAILADAHPHIGTDKLPGVIENMRKTILMCGGEVHFQTRMDGIIIKDNKVVGIQTNTGEEFLGPVILATGHSARDVYAWLYVNGVEIEAKGIAVGVRLEHQAHRIDQIQYHRGEGRGKYLPAAEYSFVTQVKGRGVYSFCMCPGGIVVPAATGPEQIVVNGMSPSHRNTAWSNSGMVVELRPEDLTLENGKLMLGNTPFDIDMESLGKNINPQGNCQLSIDNSQLKMLAFQAALERLCWMQGNYRQTAPAQRMADFVNGRLGGSLPESSYAPGLIPSPMHFWMPSFVSDRLREGLRYFGKQSHGFLTNEAVVIGVETRTSAPVRILRDKDSLQHVRVQGLFPCGEGAGYAGGIVSAAVDGERCAEAASFYLMENG
ncbi:MAG: NAD(P)/FAD-dependent oxidoreductase [Bacteroidaceae bacterium]|nr:NAD(P)/FAD-dependent oxidoreductase [Bacteroidaceae bacterium]